MSARAALIAGVLSVLVQSVFGPVVAAADPVQQTVQRKPQYRRILLDDQGLRRQATHSPPPSYPASSLANKVTGVAVAAVTTDANGRTERVEIVEAPDTEIREAVRAAAREWAYKSAGLPITGSLIFYFHIAEGRGIVSSPAEMKALKGQATAARDEAPVTEIKEADFARFRAQNSPVVIDIRDRSAHEASHRAGAINIPLKELLTRAAAELPQSRPIVIDCFADLYDSKACAVSAHFLTSSGFTQVYLLRR